MTDRFVCIGRTRGWCGHVHKSEETAQVCCRRDDLEVLRSGKPAWRADRVIYPESHAIRDEQGRYHAPPRRKRQSEDTQDSVS